MNITQRVNDIRRESAVIEIRRCLDLHRDVSLLLNGKTYSWDEWTFHKLNYFDWIRGEYRNTYNPTETQRPNQAKKKIVNLHREYQKSHQHGRLSTKWRAYVQKLTIADRKGILKWTAGPIHKPRYERLKDGTAHVPQRKITFVR